MTFELPYPPSVNRAWRYYRGRVVPSPEATKYKRTAGMMAIAAGVRLLRGPVKVTLHVYRPRKTGDLDNREKVLWDTLNGLAYDDDDQIVSKHCFRHDDPKNPRIQVTIEPATEGDLCQ